MVSNAFKICGYEIDSFRNKSLVEGIEWQRIHENSAPVGFLDNNHKRQSLVDIEEIDKKLRDEERVMMI